MQAPDTVLKHGFENVLPPRRELNPFLPDLCSQVGATLFQQYGIKNLKHSGKQKTIRMAQGTLLGQLIASAVG